MGLPEIYSLVLLLLFATYGFTIGAFTLGLMKTLKPQTMPRVSPLDFVSVIIPVRNEERNMIRILGEMRLQDFPSDFLEVIVADDHSEDATMDLVSRFADMYPEFSLLAIPSSAPGTGTSGKKMAIERAVAKAKGKILLFTDADTYRGPGWVSSMVSDFAALSVQMVLGPVYFCHERNLLQKIQSLEFMGLMGTTAGSAALGCPVMCNGANLAYRHEAFRQTGGFSGNLNFSSGDDQFMMSAIKKYYGKGALVFNSDPSASVGTEPEATLVGFLNQRIRWVSKSRGYRDPMVVSVGIVTYLTHLFLLAGIGSGIFFPRLLCLSLVLWGVKILLEYPMVWIMIRFFGKRPLAGYYVPAQVFQLCYVPLAGMLGLILPYRWKGRKG